MRRAALAPLARELAHRSGFSARAGRRDPRMRLLKLHGVGEPHYPAAAFRRQVAWLKAHFELVALDAVVAALGEPRPAAPDPDAPRRPWVALTFDDGLRNFATLVHPVLCEWGIPATVYVCPTLVDEGRWLWNHEALARLRSLDPRELPGFLAELGEGPATPRAMVERMKTLPGKRREAVAAAIRERTPGFRPAAEQRAAWDLMSWEELRSLSTSLVTVGSHTLTHPLLPYLGDAELAREVRGSRRELESRLDRPVEHFAYPSGAVDGRAVKLARECYRSACMSRPGFLEAGDDPAALRRVSMPRTLAALSWKLARGGA